MTLLEQKLAELDAQFNREYAEHIKKENVISDKIEELEKSIPAQAINTKAIEDASDKIRQAGDMLFYFKIGYTHPKKGAEPEIIFKPWPSYGARFRNEKAIPTRFLEINSLVPIPEFNKQCPDIASKLGPDVPDQLCKTNIFFSSVELLPSEEANALQERWEQMVKVITGTTEQQNKERETIIQQVQSQIKDLEKQIDENSTAFNKNKEDIGDKLTYLNRLTHLPRSQPGIAKDKHTEFDKLAFYSLWIGDSPVFLYDGKILRYLHTRRKMQPLEIKTADVETVLGGRKALSEELLGLTANKFIDYRGYTLLGEQEKIAANIFEHVFTGKEILPHEESTGGYEVREPKTHNTGDGSATQPRHWSQVYLAQKQPTNTVVGKLLGSGGSYKAYQYGDKTIVEFDQEGHATYLFATSYFDNLRTWQKTALLESQPEGFSGRLIHKENRNEWMKNIDDFVKN